MPSPRLRSACANVVAAFALLTACNDADTLVGPTADSEIAQPQPTRPPTQPEREGQEPEFDVDALVETGPQFIPADPPAVPPVSVGFDGDGIYVLPGDPDKLVLLRSDGGYAPFSLLWPVDNEHNAWQFQPPGDRISPTDPRLRKLIKVPHEGYYRITRELRFKADGRWLVGTIVQLGYTTDGAPILFIAQRRAGKPTVLEFSERGVQIRREQLQWLAPLAWYDHRNAAEPEP